MRIRLPRRRYRPGWLLLALAAVPVPLTAQQREWADRIGEPGCPAPTEVVGEGDLAFATVRYLADDALEGRLAGSPGARCAGAFIAAQFRHLGLDPGGDGGTYFQAVPLAGQGHVRVAGGTGRNVVGLLRGGDPRLAGEAVVVGAHYDHLGRGGFGSLAPGAEEIHNGADDNASGVAALLTVARALAAGPWPARTVVFVAFTGEELGLLGSSRYVQAPALPIDSTVAMLNLDMVGRLDGRPLIVYGLGTAEEWNAILADANRGPGLELAYEASGFGPSDHTSFYAAEVPVLHFFTNAHADYHRPSDDWEKVDVPGVERVARLVAGVALRMARRPGRLTVRTGVGEPRGGEGEGYGAYLGTVPDFTPVERGVRLSAVTAGSPAAVAGLLGGDIIVGLGRFPVDDLYGMTDALRSYSPGDTVEVRFLREGAPVAVHAVLGSRSERPRQP